MKRVTSIVILALAFAGVGFGYRFFSPSEPHLKSDVVEVRISTTFTAIDYAPYMAARKFGWLDSAFEGSRYKIVHADTLQSPPTLFDAMASNRIDAVLTAEVPGIIGRSSGIDLSIGWLSATLSSEIALPISASATSLKDLGGKNVGVIAGSSSHYGIARYLRMNGLPAGHMNILDLGPFDAKAAFSARKIDAWAIWPPFIEQEVLAGTAKVLSDFSTPIQVVLLLRNGFATGHPDAAKKLIAALERGKAWVRDNPENAQTMIADELKIPIDVVRMAWPKIDWSTTLNDKIIADIQDKADFLFDNGFTKRRLNVGDELLWGPSKSGRR